MLIETDNFIRHETFTNLRKEFLDVVNTKFNKRYFVTKQSQVQAHKMATCRYLPRVLWNRNETQGQPRQHRNFAGKQPSLSAPLLWDGQRSHVLYTGYYFIYSNWRQFRIIELNWARTSLPLQPLESIKALGGRVGQGNVWGGQRSPDWLRNGLLTAQNTDLPNWPHTKESFRRQ